MHYKNGREAKPGDLVVLIGSDYSAPVTGVLHSVVPSAETCNGRLALISQSDPLVTISECLHIDDVKAASIPDSTKTTEGS